MSGLLLRSNIALSLVVAMALMAKTEQLKYHLSVNDEQLFAPFTY